MLTMLAAAALTAGIVENPCAAEPEVPAEIAAWRAKVYAPDNRIMIPPPPSAASYVAAYKEARKTDWADLCHYHRDNAALLARPASERRVVFMGDSVTEGWTRSDASFGKTGWVGRGISGQTTPQMLVRFTDDVLALKPRVVHIMAGTNDVAGNTGPATMDTIVGNIAAMVTLAKAAGIRVVLAAVPPADRFSWQPDARPAPVIAALNGRLRALAARETIVFVDYGAALAQPDGAMRPALSLDGVHPNAAGYAAIRPLAVAALARAER